MTNKLKIYLDMQATQGGGGTGLGSVASALAAGLMADASPELSFYPIAPEGGRALRSVLDRVLWEQWQLPSAINRVLSQDRTEYSPVLQSLCLGSPVSLKIPTIAIVYDFIPLQDENSFRHGFAGWYFRNYLPACYKRARKLLCISQTVRNEAIEIMNREERDVSVLPMFIRPELSDAILNTPAQNRDCIVTVGTHEPRKNLTSVIGAYAKLNRNLINQYPLIIIGKNTKITPSLRQLAHELGVNNNVNFIDYVSTAELAKYYRRAIVNIFVSKFEGFGLPPLEALLAGCPSVVSDIPVHREVYAETFELAPPDNLDAIAHQISMHIENSNASDTWQKTAATLLNEKYSLQQAVAACKRVFYELY